MNTLSGLSGIRGIAALIVVIYHLNQQLPTLGLSVETLSVYNFVARLSLIVSLFFFLSGFFRAMSYWKIIDTPEKMPQFWPSLQDRWLRIAPAYIFALILSVIVTAMIHGMSVVDVPSFLAGISFTTWMSPESLFPAILNGPLWFVSFDMIGWIMTSLVMMGLFRIGKKYTIPYLIMVTLATLGLHEIWISLPWRATTQFPASYWFPLYNPFFFFLHFLFGIAAAGIVSVLRKKDISAHISYDIVFLLSLITGAVFLWTIRDVWDDFAYSIPKGPYYFPWIQILIMIGCTALPFTRYIGRWLDNSFLLFTAGLSYSLYLIHGVIIALLLSYIFPTGLTLQSWWIFAGMTLILSYISAYFMHRFIEK